MENIHINVVKLQAKRLKKVEGITHTEALNRIVKMYGYQNWNHYVNINKC